MSTSSPIRTTQNTMSPVGETKHLNGRLAMAERNEQSLVNFKIDVVVKEAAEATLSSMGISTSAYLGMCLRQLAQERKLPFSFEADPEFWIAEAQVGRAAELLRSGLFEKTTGLRKRVAEHVAAEVAKIVPQIYEDLKAYEVSLNPDDINELNCFEHSMSFLAGFGAEIVGKNFNELVRYFSNHEMPFYLDPNYPWAKAVRETLSTLYSEESRFLIQSIVDFCTAEGINSSTGKMPARETALDLASKLDEIIGTVLDEYEEHRSSFSLRFVGAVSYITSVQKALADKKEALECLEEYGIAAMQEKRSERLKQEVDENFKKLLALMDKN